GEDMQSDAGETDGLTSFGEGHRGVGQPGDIDEGDRAGTVDVHDVVRAEEGGGVLVEADTDGKGVKSEDREQPAEPVALAEVLVDDDAVGQTEARRERGESRL